MKKSTIYTIFALMMALLLAATFVSVRMRQNEERFDIGDFSGADREAAKTAFETDGSDESLIALLKILCYEYKIKGDETAVPLIRQYGQLLLDRAKAQTVDLEKMDKNGDILQILNVIRSTGAK